LVSQKAQQIYGRCQNWWFFFLWYIW
jgi:hypothetical protein